MTDADQTLNGTWKVILPAITAGWGYSLSATCLGCSIATSSNLSDIGFGDVFLCSGQSNMECPLLTTTARFETYAKTAAGDYDHIRLFQMGLRYEGGKTTSSWILPPVCDEIDCPTNSEASQGYALRTWTLPRGGTYGDDDGGSARGFFDRFSAVCWYFGKAMSDQKLTMAAAAAAAGTNTNINSDPVPIGLIASTIGGTTIQEWMPPSATGNDTCTENNCGWVEQLDPGNVKNTQPSTSPQCFNDTIADIYSCPSGVCSTLFHSMIAPFVNVTIAAAIWCKLGGKRERSD